MFIAQTLSETWFDDEAQHHRTQVHRAKLSDMDESVLSRFSRRGTRRARAASGFHSQSLDLVLLETHQISRLPLPFFLIPCRRDRVI